MMKPLTLQPFAHGIQFHGFGLRNPALQTLIDPFLSVDHFFMSQPTFPPHPHAGFSAVTYLFDDSETGFINRDSLGNVLEIKPGSLHWTGAASGVMHEEVPQVHGKTVHGLQIFVNLPAARKHDAPSVEHVAQADMPKWQIGNAAARLVFGSYSEYVSPLVPLSDATLVDLAFNATGNCDLDIPAGRQAFILIVAGDATCGDQFLTQQSGVTLGSDLAAQSISVKGQVGTRLAFFLGSPIGEPVVWGGPFVMTSQDDIRQARYDYEAGKMGHLV
jgi:redox-sensitive bicupin YhaK (pirin superfamily)